MKRFNITTVKTYTKNNEEKKVYPVVGTLVRFDATTDKPESFLLELNMFPQTKFYVFEEKPKEGTTPQGESKTLNELPTVQVEGVSDGAAPTSDIPF